MKSIALLPLVLSLILSLATAIAVMAQQVDIIAQGFQRGDADADGKLSRDELEKLPRLKTKAAGADKDGDGFITLAEFRAHLAGGAKPQPVTGKLSPGDHSRMVMVGETPRRYEVHVPGNYDAAKPTPVIIAFHGGGGNPASMIRLSGLNAKSEQAGFIVVYPYGTGKLENTLLTFNGGDWQPGDPTWKDGKGKGVAGVLGSDEENAALDFLTPHTARQSKGRHWEIAPQQIEGLLKKFRKPVVDDEPARNGTSSFGGQLREKESRRKREKSAPSPVPPVKRDIR